MANEVGILSFGAYVPRLRLQRTAIAAANAWFSPGLRGMARGERSMANWDEDTVTMAVEAARDCLAGFDAASVAALSLASTTHPFDDRQNTSIVAGALNLRRDVRSLDVSGSLRAGTSALATAVAAARGTDGAELLMAAEHRLAKAASPQEMQYGDGAAAVLVGAGRPVATLVGAHAETVDFVPQFRAQDRAHDYAWEERWVRDEGYMKIVPRAVGALLTETRTDAASVSAHSCLPCTLSRVVPGVAKRIGIPDAAVRDNLAAVCGDTGAAHPLVMLAHALEAGEGRRSHPGRRLRPGLRCASVRVTDAIATLPPRRGVKGSLARRKEERSTRSTWRSTTSSRSIAACAPRSTRAPRSARSTATVDMITGLIGGRCRNCGTVQFPKGRYCVNPNCERSIARTTSRSPSVPPP